MVITYETGSGLYVNMTNRCTNSCEFCVRSQADGTYGHLWLDREPTADEIFDDIMKRDLSKYTELVFCGYGEPAMRFYDMTDVAGRVKKVSDIPIRVNTNGHANLIYGKDVTPLMKGVIDTVSISLNTANAADYVKTCHPDFGEAAYPGLIDFADKAKHYVKHVLLSVVRESIPDSDIEKCAEIANKIGVELRVREMIK